MREGAASFVVFDRMQPGDLFAIERQPSQARLLGAEIDAVQWDEADALAAQPVAWTARHGGRIVAVFGVAEQFAGKHGVAWAVLAQGLGTAHLAVSRKAAEVVRTSGLNRVDLIARAAQTPFHLKGEAGLRWALDAKRASAECRWARMLGFAPGHVLHGYGAACETHVLFEWFGGGHG
ncbi:hypothetical protein [Novosphingobium colocasiae]|uniref:hypothetical protein n=1 Tax=Novosphingobium colocasiae TaxID=1256513 RepID=UPI0035B060DC